MRPPACTLLAALPLVACATTNSATLATNQIEPKLEVKVDTAPGGPGTFVSAILQQPGSLSRVQLAPGDVLTAKTDKDAQLAFNYDSVLQIYSFTLSNVADRASVTVMLTRAGGAPAPASTVQLPPAMALTSPAPNADVAYKGGSGAVPFAWSNPGHGGNVHFFPYPCGSAAVTTRDIQAPDTGSFSLSARDLVMSPPPGKQCVTIRMERDVTGSVDTAFAPTSAFTALRWDYVNVNVVP
jgi:hypothetical protein